MACSNNLLHQSFGRRSQRTNAKIELVDVSALDSLRVLLCRLL
jgi:hypothetical protein